MKNLFRDFKTKELVIHILPVNKFLGKLSILKILKAMSIFNDIFFLVMSDKRKEVFAMFSGSYDMAYKLCNIYQDITFSCSFPLDLPMEY